MQVVRITGVRLTPSFVGKDGACCRTGTGCYCVGQHGPYTVPRGSLVACNEKARMMRASSEGLIGLRPSKLLIHQPKQTR